MDTTIIYVHPSPTSFNHAILSSIVSHVESKKKSVKLIDLYQDNFDPVLNNNDLTHYNSGNTTDPLVKKYQGYLTQTSELVIIAPIWWYELPAMFKGFLDKVLLVNFAFKETNDGIKGLLSHIKKTTLITTSGSKTKFMGDYINDILIKKTFSAIGIKQVTHYNLGDADNLDTKQKQVFIEKIMTHFSQH